MNILDLCTRKDGFLTRSSDATDSLCAAGKITTVAVGDGYVIARAVQPRARPYHVRSSAMAVAAEIGRVM
jgi:hypothetical protein